VLEQAEKRKRRSFTREYKLSVLARMKTTDNIQTLARELGLERKLLYCWRDKFEAGGVENLRRAGRPAAAGAAEGAQPDAPVAASVADPQQRIRELERKIGQQQLDLDFFRAALRQVRGQRQQTGAPGVKASTP